MQDCIIGLVSQTPCMLQFHTILHGGARVWGFFGLVLWSVHVISAFFTVDEEMFQCQVVIVVCFLAMYLCLSRKSWLHLLGKHGVSSIICFRVAVLWIRVLVRGN